MDHLFCPQNFELLIEGEIFAPNSCRAFERRSYWLLLNESASRFYLVIITAIRPPSPVISFLGLMRKLARPSLALHSYRPWAGGGRIYFMDL